MSTATPTPWMTSALDGLLGAAPKRAAARRRRPLAEWRPLRLEGFDELGLYQTVLFRTWPLEHLAWIVTVSPGRLVEFPSGLVLQYGLRAELARGKRAAAKLRALATAHLKRDLVQAMDGALPDASRGVLLVDGRGWEEEVVEL